MDYNSIDFSFNALESKLLNDSHGDQELDYDPEFIELENMVAIKAEQQYGETIIPAAPIDWSKALNKACELLTRSKDYRLCCIITRALTHKYGVRGTLKGIEGIHSLTEQCWQQAHPAIMFDGETDLLPRANAIAELNSASGLVGDLRITDINLGAVGKITVGRLEKILSGRDENESFSRDQVLQVLRDELNKENVELLAIKQIISQISLIEKQLATLFGVELTPDFTQLKSLLTNANPITEMLTPETEDSTEDFSQPNDSPEAGKSFATNTTATIKTRADAIKLLDKVCVFLEHNDPSNPAPLLIKRARNMIGQDFFTILSQLAPDAISQAEQVTGTQF